MKKIAQMSKRELQRLANESDSIRQMLENAGYSRNSGSMQQRLSERIKLEGIDGDCRNHSLENLCFLCPNCHSQTDTYAGKNRGKYKS